jgi:hypothetical protein
MTSLPVTVTCGHVTDVTCGHVNDVTSSKVAIDRKFTKKNSKNEQLMNKTLKDL